MVPPYVVVLLTYSLLMMFAFVKSAKRKKTFLNLGRHVRTR